MTHHERRLWDAAARVVEAQDFVEQDAPNAPEKVAKAIKNLRSTMTSIKPFWFGGMETF
jgi:xanthine dehydrogenase molybdopterin-binding subunit B